MMRHGRFVLILDAFDEVADQLDRRGVIRLFSKIRELAGPLAKIVLTGRTHYFHNESQALDVLAPRIEAASSSGADDRANFRVLELMKFDEAQIKSLMRRHWSPEGTDEQWRKMLEIHDLADLARTPMLTHLIISSLDGLSTSESRSEVNSAKLYDRYTKIWLDRDDHRASVTADERRRFMEELAWRMYRDDRLSVPYEELEEVVAEFVPRTRRGDVDWMARLDTNTRTCSFLARNRQGDYQFAHKSFMEFFVAKTLVRQMDSWSRVDDLWPRPVPYEISSFVGQLVSGSPKDLARLKVMSVDRTNNGFLRGLCIDVQMMLGDTVKDEPMIFAVAVSPDGRQVATACGDGSVRIFDADLEPVAEFTEHREWVRALAYSRDGRYFVSGGWDKRVVVRSMPDYRVHLELALPDRVNAVCFSPDGTQIICGGYDRIVSIWDLETGRMLRSLVGHSDSVQSIVLDAGSNAAISGSTDRTVRKWSLDDAGGDVPFRALGGPIRCVAISPDGRHIATGSWTGELILWDVGQLRRAWQSTSHKNMISDFGFAPDGARFVSCSDDGSIKAWSIDSDQPIMTLQGDDFVVTVCYSADGGILYSGGYDSVIRAWDSATWTLVKSTPLKGIHHA
jgi:WD40 repeat protein